MSAGATPDFEPSPARFTWTSAGTSRRRAAESESSEWTSSQIRFTTLTLFDWRWPMKCQRNASPYSACFSSRSCARFSPTTVMPAATRMAMSGSETYFVAATTVTRSPTCARTAASRSAMRSGDSTEHPLDAPLATASPVREEEILVTAGAQVDALDRGDTGAAQDPFGGAPQIEMPRDRQVV